MGGLDDMNALIESIVIKERIRKEIGHIPELAADIKRNGLLHPITVMEVSSGELCLLAGLRRIKAAQMLGWAEIEVKVVAPADAEAALNIEISENEQRDQFTFSEKMDYGLLLDEIEAAKAKDRQTEGQSLGGTIAGRGRQKDDSIENRGSQCYESKKERTPQTRDVVGGKIGMSGPQYDRAKYVAYNAPPEVIEQLDRGERTIRGTYNELRAKEKVSILEPGVTHDDEPHSEAPDQEDNTIWLLSEKVAENHASRSKSGKDDPYYQKQKAEAAEAARNRAEYESLTPEGKIEVLQRQIKEHRANEATMQADIANLRERFKISVDHKDSIIEFLKQQNAKLTEALEAANARIAELESRG